jgi:hypothetical protein
MFGPLKVTTTLKLSKLQTLEEAVAKLLQFADYPNIVGWFQFPTALVVFPAWYRCHLPDQRQPARCGVPDDCCRGAPSQAADLQLQLGPGSSGSGGGSL